VTREVARHIIPSEARDPALFAVLLATPRSASVAARRRDHPERNEK